MTNVYSVSWGGLDLYLISLDLMSDHEAGVNRVCLFWNPKVVDVGQWKHWEAFLKQYKGLRKGEKIADLLI